MMMIRQGSVFSPFLFALYLDDFGKLFDPASGCYIITLLLSPSVTYIERLLHLCQNELAGKIWPLIFKK